MLGAAFALLSAVAFSVNAVLIRRGVVIATPAQATFITVIMGVPMFFIASLVSGQLLRLESLAWESYAYLAAAGVVNFVAGRQFNYMAIEAIGAARAAPFQAMTLPYSVLIAFFFLDESISLGVAVGVAFVMIGPVIMVERRRQVVVAPLGDEVLGPLDAETPHPETPQFQLRQVEGYTFALLAAVAYGTSPILFRAALEGETGLSAVAGLVSYVAAAIVLIAGVALPGRTDVLRSLQPATMRLFFGASFSVFIAQILRFLALSLAPVAVVTSLERANSIFTLVLSYRMNRVLELITFRVVLGILISVAGTLIVIASL